MEISKSFVKKLFPSKPPWSHKGDNGKVLIVGGSKLYSGSPYFAAMAALKTGSDLVMVFSPKRSANIVASFSPDIITFPARGDYLNSWHLQDALRLMKQSTSIVIGGGLERKKETQIFFEKFISKNTKPCVIDADGLYFLSEEENLIQENYILTPHSHEFFLLTGKQPTDNIKERQGLVQRFAKKLNCTILLKGNVDVISDGKKTAINRTGNPFMTSGGTGDVLAGICGSLLNRGNPFEAACAAAWINGSVGDIVAKNFGESFTSNELLNNIHMVL